MTLLLTIYYRLRYRLLWFIQAVRYHADGYPWTVASYGAARDVHRLWEDELRAAKEEVEQLDSQEGGAA